MAIRSGFFNSINGDRKYDAGRFAEYFASFIGNGVFPNPSTGLQVIANNDMTVTVKAGKAWINGYIIINDDDYILNIDPADGVLSRVDRIVIRYDVSDRGETPLIIKKGTFASSPIAPELQRDADAYELGIADILISNGAVSITQANITDLRMNSTYCGIVTGTVDQIDATNLFAQYDVEFRDWFATLEDVLDENTAANLLNLINQNTSQLAEKTKILTASGTENDITLNVTLEDKGKYSFKAVSDSTGVVTVNGRVLKKINGAVVNNIKANKVYDFYYDSVEDCVFILAKAEGDANVGDVLAGKVFSNEDDSGLVGTMDLSNLLPENIKEGVDINGIIGTLTEGKIAYGTLPDMQGATQTTQTQYTSYVNNLTFIPNKIILYFNLTYPIQPSGTTETFPLSLYKYGSDVVGNNPSSNIYLGFSSQLISLGMSIQYNSGNNSFRYVFTMPSFIDNTKVRYTNINWIALKI